jgi:rod shape-determining protein MreD
MSLYFTIPFLALLAIFQATAAPQISIAGGQPDLLLLCVMSWELVQTRGEGYSWALIGGIGLDLLGGGPFGASILGLLAVTLVADALGGGLFRHRVVVPLIAAVASTFAFHGVYLIVLMLFGWKLDLGDAIVRVMLPSALMNMLLSPIAYRLMAALHRRMNPASLSW